MARLKRFQYVTKDQNSILQDTIARLKQTYGENTWNDFEEDNVGRMLIEAFAYDSDLLLYYLDRQANEAFLTTATERQNILNHSKMLGYTPKNSTPAQAEILVSLEKTQDYDITLPAGTLLYTQQGLRFETQTDAVIIAGELSTTTTALEGETFTEVLGVSNGEAWQNFYISRSGVLNIVDVTINDHTWELVESFAEEDSASEVFTAESDAWRRVEILFGDGNTGKIPEADERIYITYRVGGGIVGNVAPNTITQLRDVATDSQGNTIHLNVTNPEWASGGSEPENNESIKLWAPRYYEAQERCVTKQDYDTFANRYDGIAKAQTIMDEEARKNGEANIVHVYVLTYGDSDNTVALANETLKYNLKTYLNKYKMLTDWIEVHDGKFSNVDFVGALTIAKGFSSDSILAKVREVLNTFMSIDTRDMGEALRISDVYSVIDNIEGVSFVELTNPSETITPDSDELLVLGNINFSVNVT